MQIESTWTRCVDTVIKEYGFITTAWSERGGSLVYALANIHTNYSEIWVLSIESTPFLSYLMQA